MTSPTSARTSPARCARRGFTLVELLVVIGIIVVLAGLLTPMVNKAYKQADRSRTKADLLAIGTALEAYKQDHGDYPRVATLIAPSGTAYATEATRPNPPTGAQVLCTALIGPAPAEDTAASATQRKIADGAIGPGFRRRPGGKVYPPYLPPDRFKMADPDNPANTNPVTHALVFCILDRYNKPILYFPASPAKPNVRVTAGTPYVAASDTAAYYDSRDNLDRFKQGSDTDAIALQKIRLMLGDADNSGRISDTETPISEPFLLWSAGPDEIHGPTADLVADAAVLDMADVAKCDDVTNFRE